MSVLQITVSLKITYSIVKNKDDIIFLSNTRLNSTNQISGLNDLEKKLACFGYNFYHNSRRSSRGVGLLISRKLKHTVVKRVVDEDDNILLLGSLARAGIIGKSAGIIGKQLGSLQDPVMSLLTG